MMDDNDTWTWGELQQDFELLGIHAPFVAVRRRADGQVGSVMFARKPWIIPPPGEWIRRPPRFRDFQPKQAA